MERRFPECPPLKIYAVVPSADWVERLATMAINPEMRVGAIQLREKKLSGEALTREIERSVSIAQEINIPLFINDHWREALNAKAYGVHLGQEDWSALSFNDINLLHQSGIRLGISTHSTTELVRALSIQPSYIAIGAIFPTTTKTMPTQPQGLENLRTYLQQVKGSPLMEKPWSVRTVAIGGIFLENAREVIATGVDSIAIVRAITESTDPATVIKQLNAYF